MEGGGFVWVVSVCVCVCVCVCVWVVSVCVCACVCVCVCVCVSSQQTREGGRIRPPQQSPIRDTSSMPETFQDDSSPAESETRPLCQRHFRTTRLQPHQRHVL